MFFWLIKQFVDCTRTSLAYSVFSSPVPCDAHSDGRVTSTNTSETRSWAECEISFHNFSSRVANECVISMKLRRKQSFVEVSEGHNVGEPSPISVVCVDAVKKKQTYKIKIRIWKQANKQ